jgi:hypothetical protein
MVDTLVFRLNNLRQYPLIAQALHTDTGKEYFLTKSEKLPVKQSISTFLMDYGSHEAVPIKYTDKRRIPSSNYDIPIWADWTREFVEVNVSIPKMLYGNNICELVIPPGHRDFSADVYSPYKQIDYVYEMIKKTIKKLLFLLSNGNYFELNWDDIEIMRLDLCINQHFESKDEALRYLDYQRAIRKKHSRIDGRSNEAGYKTSIAFKNERYYAKIYHKGTEFRDIQSKKIIELNKKRRRSKLPYLSSNIEYAEQEIQHLQDYSDKILRYELEFKAGYMSYVFNYKVNKVWSENWIRCVKLFTYFKRNVHMMLHCFDYTKRWIDTAGNFHVLKPVAWVRPVYFHRIWNEILGQWEQVEFTKIESKRFHDLKSFGIVSKAHLKEWMKKMERELFKSRHFFISLPADYQDTTMKDHVDKETGEVVPLHIFTPTERNVRFTKSLLFEMVQATEGFFTQFQFITKGAIFELEDKVAEYNLQVAARVRNSFSEQEAEKESKKHIGSASLRNLVQFHRMHTKLTQKQLVPKMYSRMTYYRIMKKYKEVTGQREQIASSYFSPTIQTDYQNIYGQLYIQVNFGFMSKFYSHSILI